MCVLCVCVPVSLRVCAGVLPVCEYKYGVTPPKNELHSNGLSRVRNTYSLMLAYFEYLSSVKKTVSPLQNTLVSVAARRATPTVSS